ncbi:hypothetical protein BCR34DRAFT_594728 [Clohesyomyces aquaticus]|uniref:F-box domain-containing protein n=1 Tax=Clohesyomyces aquaticus TaxID=1231657 RepID=A0A1Y1Y5K1_9PLEO|nr:hypothetical protein BCR34DRAFT_594728 [Clohesyomyces aquaticus]
MSFRPGITIDTDLNGGVNTCLSLEEYFVMESSNISILPDDIMITVATELRRSDSARADLSAFVLVQKRWYHIGIPVLYGNIAFSVTTIKRLRTSFPAEKFGEHVRSLTLQIRCPPRSKDHFSEHEDPLAEDLAAVVPTVQHLTNLASFSLVLRCPNWGFFEYLPRSVVVAILDELPESCINLELDIGPQNGLKGEVHVCDTIRSLLPRLRNLRIRVGEMCGAIFGMINENGDNFEPVSIPKVNSMVVNCGYDGEEVEKCTMEDWGSAWPLVTESLSRLIAQGSGVASSGAKVYAMMNTDEWLAPPKIGVFGVIRVDMMAKTSWAFPKWFERTPATPTLGPSLFHAIRVPGYDFWAEDYDTIEAIAEGQLWRDVRGGGRLPVEVLQAERNNLPSFGTGCVEKPLEMHKNWVEGGDWGGELLFAQETGDDYLSLKAIRTIEP